MKQENNNVMEGFEFFVDRGRSSSPDFALLNEKTGRLNFSVILMERLGIRDWENVLLAFNKKTKAIMLKKCNVEEYGSRQFAENTSDTKTKSVSLKGLVKFFSVETVRQYKRPNLTMMLSS